MDTQHTVRDARMDIRVSFPGGRKVDAQVGRRLVRTDQSVEHGGDGTAPEPFELFLGSLATCAGTYVANFCQARQIPVDGIELVQSHQLDAETGHLVRVDLHLTLPPAFPEKYRALLVSAVNHCRVKQALAWPPEIVVKTCVADVAESCG